MNFQTLIELDFDFSLIPTMNGFDVHIQISSSGCCITAQITYVILSLLMNDFDMILKTRLSRGFIRTEITGKLLIFTVNRVHVGGQTHLVRGGKITQLAVDILEVEMDSVDMF